MNTTLNHNRVTPGDHSHSKMCMTTVLGGVFSAVIIGIALNFLGAGIGFSAFAPTVDNIETLSFMSVVWLFLAGILSNFMGGWITSYFSCFNHAGKGYWQGFIVASVSVLLTVCIATSSMGYMMSGTFSTLGKLVSSSDKVVASSSSSVTDLAKSASNLSKNDLFQNVKNMMPAKLQPAIDQISADVDSFVENVSDEATNQDVSADDAKQKAQQVKDKAKKYKHKVTAALNNFFSSIDTDNFDKSRENLINLIADVSGKSKEAVEEKVTAWEKTYQETKAKATQMAKEAANKTASMMSYFSFLSFAIIFVSLVAGGLGGVCGSRRNMHSTHV